MKRKARTWIGVFAEGSGPKGGRGNVFRERGFISGRLQISCAIPRRERSQVPAYPAGGWAADGSSVDGTRTSRFPLRPERTFSRRLGGHHGAGCAKTEKHGESNRSIIAN